MRSRGVSAHIETGPATVDYGMTLDRPFTTGIEPVARGPVRLVIDMPVRSSPYIIVAAILAPTMAVIGALEFAGLAKIGGNAFPSTAWLWVLLAALLIFFVTIWFMSATSTREILTIDSRFVTLVRGKNAVVIPRRRAGEVELVEPPDGQPSVRSGVRFSHRWLRFTRNGDVLLATGSEISREAAIHLEARIRDFMDEHPSEPGFDPPIGGSQTWPMPL